MSGTLLTNLRYILLKLIIFWQIFATQTSIASSEVFLFVKALRPDIIDLGNEIHRQDSSILPKLIKFEDSSDIRRDDIVVAIGMSAYKEVHNKQINTPLITSYITSIQYNQKIAPLKNINTTRKHEVALFTDPQILNQLKLAKLIFPIDLKLGVFLSEASRFLENEIKTISSKLEIPVHIIPYTRAEDFYKGLNRKRRFDAILALPDKKIYNRKSIKAIFETTYYENTSIIGYSPSMVRAGAIATTYIDVIELAKQILVEVNRYKKNHRFGQNRFIPSNSISINKDVANSLNIILPEESNMKRELLRSVP
jgi:ABC-type uncharacterized transport system substrate-binding protein